MGKLTEDQVREVVNLRQQDDIAVSDIAEMMGVSETTIYRVLKKENVVARQASTLLDKVDTEDIVSMYQDFYPLNAIAEKHSITLSQIYYVLRTVGVESRSKQNDALADRQARLDTAVQMYQDGFFIHEITGETGIAQPTLHQELRNRKVPFRRPRSNMSEADVVARVREHMESTQGGEEI